MKLDLKENNDFQRTLHVVMPWEEIKEDYQKEFNRIKNNFTPPGGRKGKVFGEALALFKKNYTPSIEAQFVDNAVNVYYKKALQELKIVPINQGQIKNLDFNEGKDMKFEISFEVKPSIKLPNYKKKVTLKTEQYIANKSDVEATYKDLQTQHATAKTVDGALKNGHFIYADFHKLDDNGLEIENAVMKNHYIKIGEGLFVDQLAKQFIGKKINDKITISIPQESGNVNYNVIINKIEEQILPKVDDEFAKTVDPKVKNLKELNENILNNIQINLDTENKKTFDNQIVDYFIDKVKFKVPDSMIENYRLHLIEKYKQQFSARNQAFDESKHKDEIQSASEKTVKWHLISEKIIQDADLKVSAKEVDEHINNLMKESPKHKKEIKKYYSEQSNKFSLHEEIINKKLFKELDNYFINKKKEISTDKLRKTKRK